jgi:hypothetical protein
MALMRWLQITLLVIGLLLAAVVAQANWYEYHVLRSGEDDAAYFDRGWEVSERIGPQYLVFRRPRLRF